MVIKANERVDNTINDAARAVSDFTGVFIE